MDNQELMETVGYIAIFLIAVATSVGLIYGYANASPEDQALILWFTMMQQQE